MPNSTGTTPALALTWNPVPGVAKTTPRGELTLKKLAGRLFGADKASGTPSQLISRRRPPNEPLAPATIPPPRSFRNASRAGVIAAALTPVPSSTTTANAAVWNMTMPASRIEESVAFIGFSKVSGRSRHVVGGDDDRRVHGVADVRAATSAPERQMLVPSRVTGRRRFRRGGVVKSYDTRGPRGRVTLARAARSNLHPSGWCSCHVRSEHRSHPESLSARGSVFTPVFGGRQSLPM